MQSRSSTAYFRDFATIRAGSPGLWPSLRQAPGARRYPAGPGARQRPQGRWGR